jgi:nitroreductase
MIEAFREIIKTRRSVRIFLPEDVPSAVINEAIDLACLAPSSSNLQPWQYVWVRDPSRKDALVKACLSQPAARTAAELVVILAQTRTWKDNAQRMLDYLTSSGSKVPPAVLKYYRIVIPMALNQGPLGIFGLIKRLGVWAIGLFRPIPREPMSKADVDIWAIKSVALSAQNFMLAIRALGYDTCPMEGFDSKRVKKLVNAPKGSHVVMVVAVGKGDPKGVYGERIRFERDLFVKYL